MNAQIFRMSDSDCLVTEDFCDGKKHYSRTLASFLDDKKSIQVDRTCDGSCKPESRMHDLRALLAKAESDSLQEEDGRILPTVIELDEIMTSLVAMDQPIKGFEFASMYAKRNCRSSDYCIGSLHVHWDEIFDWHLERKPETFATHKLSASLCDGSCCQTTKLTRGEKRSVRKQERERKAWEAEWHAKYSTSV